LQIGEEGVGDPLKVLFTYCNLVAESNLQQGVDRLMRP